MNARKIFTLFSVALFPAYSGCTPDAEASIQHLTMPPDQAVSTSVTETPADDMTTALSMAFRSAAQGVLPSVVYVSVERDRPTSRLVPQIPQGFRPFFQFQNPGIELPPQRNTGSGFVLDSDGHVVTNHHVVANATRVTVRMHDGRELDASVVGGDPTTDVAVIKLEELLSGVSQAHFGDSDAIQIGDWVLALGNPLGLDFTVTAGIVSARGRRLSNNNTALESYIQTDAAINPGNSGGPLIDLRGRVVGINTAIAGGGNRFVGYGFAVPATLAQRVVEDLLQFGYVRRPRIGARVSDVNAADAEAYQLNEVRGAEINVVEPDSPAERSGLLIGDVVLAIDDEPVQNANDLTTALAERDPGDEVSLTVVREGTRRAVEIELGEFPRAEEDGNNARSNTDSAGLLGLTVGRLSAAEIDKLEHRIEGGVIVTDVQSFGPAANAGIRRGQIILKINGEQVNTPAEFRSIIGEIENGEVVSIRLIDQELGETIVNFRTPRN